MKCLVRSASFCEQNKICAVFFILVGVRGVFISRPKNLAASVGEEVILNCSISNGADAYFPQWDNSKETIFDGEYLFTKFETRGYKMIEHINETLKTFDLVIGSLQQSDGDVYTCLHQTRSGTESYAKSHLVVFGDLNYFLYYYYFVLLLL